MKILTVLILSATIGATTMHNSKLPEVTTAETFKKNDGKKIILIGTYTPMMLPKSKRPGSPMIPSGRVSINLDRYEIALDRDKKGYRDSTEVKKFSGKKVKVTGTASKMTTLWGSGQEQSIVMPAILEVKNIELAE